MHPCWIKVLISFSLAITGIKYNKTILSNCNNILLYYCFYCIFHQINADLVSTRDSSKETFVKISLTSNFGSTDVILCISKLNLQAPSHFWALSHPFQTLPVSLFMLCPPLLSAFRQIYSQRIETEAISKQVTDQSDISASLWAGRIFFFLLILLILYIKNPAWSL